MPQTVSGEARRAAGASGWAGAADGGSSRTDPAEAQVRWPQPSSLTAAIPPLAAKITPHHQEGILDALAKYHGYSNL